MGGRLPLLLQAARRVKAEIGSEVPVGVGVSGPFSICCELMGFEQFILCCLGEPEEAETLLGTVATFLADWCDAILSAGLGLTLFDSWAAPALVIGGNTQALLADILSTGTGMVIADYNTDLPCYVEQARGRGLLLLRGNIDPKLVASGPEDALLAQVRRVMQAAGGYAGFVLGTGVLPYDTPAGHVLALRDFSRTMG